MRHVINSSYQTAKPPSIKELPTGTIFHYSTGGTNNLYMKVGNPDNRGGPELNKIVHLNTGIAYEVGTGDHSPIVMPHGTEIKIFVDK